MSAHCSVPGDDAPLAAADVPALVLRPGRCAAVVAAGPDGGHVRRSGLGRACAVPHVGRAGKTQRSSVAREVLRDERAHVCTGPTRPGRRVVLLTGGVETSGGGGSPGGVPAAVLLGVNATGRVKRAGRVHHAPKVASTGYG